MAEQYKSDLENLKRINKKTVEMLNLPDAEFDEVYSECATLPMGTYGIDAIIEMFSGKWKMMILSDLYKRKDMRYSELKRSLLDYGITNYMLTKSLKELQKDNLVEKIVFPEVPPHTEYRVTPKARELIKLFLRMTEWNTRYRIQEIEAKEKNNSFSRREQIPK